ncbi:hypothetical protein BZA05DRAFT_194131 [Tricharina praecox]|uniref:uncharacterized protein n=1 Tax=Tricharina praecox TaxID=43433 RepID=UPI0022211D75|nr:uncharacterized protein BZA05DRAFT_194131 [Tricharina praecox]KAI5842368.1 hypothetical protein BZA05DRAFT_194131 [Tricharina praecox]
MGWLFRRATGFKMVTVVIFGFAFENNGRMQCDELTRQFDSNRTLIIITDAADSVFIGLSSTHGWILLRSAVHSYFETRRHCTPTAKLR